MPDHALPGAESPWLWTSAPFGARRGLRAGERVFVRAGSPTSHDHVEEPGKPMSQRHDCPGTPARQQECRAAVNSPDNGSHNLDGWLSMRGFRPLSGLVSQGHLAELALRSTGTCGPNSHPRTP